MTRNQFDNGACGSCDGRCCTLRGREVAYVPLLPSDIVRLAAHFYLSPSDYRARYVETTDGRLHLADPAQSCLYLNEKGQCSIYEIRPAQCKSWPFTDYLLSADDETWEKETSWCPGVGQGPALDAATIEKAAARARPLPLECAYALRKVWILNVGPCPQCDRSFNTPDSTAIAYAQKQKKKGQNLPTMACPGCGASLTPRTHIVQSLTC